MARIWGALFVAVIMSFAAPAAHAADFITYTVTTKGQGTFATFSSETGKPLTVRPVSDFGFAFTVPASVLPDGAYVSVNPSALPANNILLSLTPTQLIFSGGAPNTDYMFRLTTCLPQPGAPAIACDGTLTYNFNRFGFGNSYTGTVDLVSAISGIGTPPAGFGLTAAVPEPATWAMMLTGFALAAQALRRRRAWRAATA